MWRFEKKSSVQKIEDSLMRHVVSISLSQKRCGNYINIVKHVKKKLGSFFITYISFEQQMLTPWKKFAWITFQWLEVPVTSTCALSLDEEYNI